MTSPPETVRRLGLFAALGGSAWVLSLLSGERVAGLLGATAAVALPSAVLSLLIGGVVGLLITKTEAAGRGVALAVAGAMTLAPITLLAAGWMSALGDGGWAPALFSGDGPVRGWLAGRVGAVLLHGVAGAPLAALLAVAAFRLVDRRKEEEALLDGSATRVLWRVTLPQAAPALGAAGLLIAVLAAGEMTITDLLRVRTFAEEVYTQTAAGQLGVAVGGGGGIALGVGAIGVAAVAALRGLSGLAGERPTGSTATRGVRFPRNLGVSVLLWLLIGLLAAVPVGSMLYNAGLVTKPQPVGAARVWDPAKLAGAVAAAPWQHRRELWVSLTLAAALATTATAAGAALAWFGRRKGLAAAVVGALIAVLVATPGPVVGLVVIRLLNQPLDSPVWWLGELYGSWFAPWLAQQLRITPVIALILWPAMASAPAGLLEAARVDGARPWQRGLRIVAPLLARPFVAAWLVAFALSLGELAATVLVTPPGTPPLPVRMLSLLHYGVEDRVAALGLVLVAGYAVVAVVALGLLSGWTGSGKMRAQPE